MSQPQPEYDIVKDWRLPQEVLEERDRLAGQGTVGGVQAELRGEAAWSPDVVRRTP